MRTAVLGVVCLVWGGVGCGGLIESTPAETGILDSGIDVVTDVVLADSESTDVPTPWDSHVPEDTSPDTAGLLEWSACGGGFSGVCTELAVPRDYAVKDGKTIPLYINRIASSPRSKAQIWILQGGPGGSGADMVPLGRQIAEEIADFDVYTLDHRGVGLSAALDCNPPVDSKDPISFIKDCAKAFGEKYGNLEGFSTTNAARDLAYAIDKTKKPGQKVFVYGVSYGTYLAHRYAQVFPDQATGVILDSVVPSDAQYLSTFDLQYDPVAKKRAEFCRLDPLCKSKFGDDPWAKIQSILKKLQGGHCKEAGIAPDKVKGFFAFSLQVNWLSAFLFTSLYRLDRCAPGDVAAIKTLSARFTEIDGSSTFSNGLYWTIAFSELWETPAPSFELLKGRYDGQTIATGVMGLAPVQEFWPRYKSDEFVRKWATDFKGSILMLNGDLDVQTPIESSRLAEKALSGANRFFMFVPNSNHSVVNQSELGTTRPGAPPGLPCGFQILAEYLVDPTKRPVASCMGSVAKPSFAPNLDYTTYFYGVADAWENTKTMSLPIKVEPPKELGWIRRLPPVPRTPWR